MLNTQQIARYHELGYLVVENALQEEQLEPIRAAASRIVEEFDIDKHRTVFSTQDHDRGRDRYFMESAQKVSCFLEADALDEQGQLTRPKHQCINKIGHALHDLVPEFTAFCRLPQFAETIRDIGCREPVLWQTMYIFKQPGIGGEVRWHQDASYLITNPPAVTGYWIALEDAHKGNGCLWVQPGGHNSPLREIFEVQPGADSGVLRALNDCPWPGDNEAVALEVPAGSIVMFHDHMPHYSSHNHSEQSRQALTLHLSEKNARWDQKNWLQRPDLRDFEL